MKKGNGNTIGSLLAPSPATGGSASQANPPLTEQELDDLQLLLDSEGRVHDTDLINATISVIRGDFAGVLFNLFSAIPAIGDAGKGAKIVKDIDKYLDVVNRLQDTVIKKIPNKAIANKLQKVLNEAKEELHKQKPANKRLAHAKANNNQRNSSKK